MNISNMSIHITLIRKLFEAIFAGINKWIWKMNAFNMSHNVGLLGAWFLAYGTQVASFTSVVMDIFLQNFPWINWNKKDFFKIFKIKLTRPVQIKPTKDLYLYFKCHLIAWLPLNYSLHVPILCKRDISMNCI